MPDRESVMQALKDSLRNQHCGFIENVGNVYAVSEETINDTLDLLKEQEALPIVYETNEYTGLPIVHCPSCGEYLEQFHSGAYGKETKFCYYCGQEVRWD